MGEMTHAKVARPEFGTLAPMKTLVSIICRKKIDTMIRKESFPGADLLIMMLRREVCTMYSSEKTIITPIPI